MKKVISVFLALLLLCSALMSLPAVSADSTVSGSACTRNEDGSISVGNNGYYSLQKYTRFSQGESATLTISVDQIGTDWYSQGLTIVVNAVLEESMPASVWQSTGAEGTYTHSFCDNGSGSMMGRIYRIGAGTGSTAAADWATAPLSGDITIEVKQNSSGVTALFLNGAQWVPHSSTGFSIPDGYLAIATSPGSKVTVMNNEVVYGRNYISYNTYEDGKTGIWTNGNMPCTHSIIEDGYASAHALHSALSSPSAQNRLSSADIPFGEEFGQLPLGVWCDWNFKIRTNDQTEAGIGAMATVKTSKGKSFNFTLSVVNRAPLNGASWLDVYIGFKLEVTDNVVSVDIKRYDWSYLLGDDSIYTLEEGETLESVSMFVYVNEAELWFDDVKLSYVKQNANVETSLSATPEKVAVGEEFTVNYTVKNLGETAITDFPYSFKYNSLMLENLSATEGTVSVGAGESQTVSARFKVLEGGAAIITAESSAGAADASVRVSCTGRGYYFGDSHSHSTKSDGYGTPYENLKQLYDLGMSFNISADHNAEIGDPELLTEWDNALLQLREDYIGDHDFIQITANENSQYADHALQYFTNVRFDSATTNAGWQEIIAKQKALGGLTFVAHPFLKTNKQFWPNLNLPETGSSVILPEYREMDGIEIINSQTLDQTSETIPKALEWWDRYNITGWNRYIGIGNSDGHRLYELAGSYNCLLLDELTEENIMDAYANGNLYMTMGPQLRYTLGGADMGDNAYIAGTSGDLELKVTAYTPNGTPLEKVVVYRYAMGSDIDALYEEGQKNAIVLYERQAETELSRFDYNGTIRVNAGEFVRVEVYAANDPEMVMGNYQMAFSNPIWVVSDDTKALQRIDIAEEPVKTEYAKGEALDLDGLKVKAFYTDGTEGEVAGYTITPAEGTSLTTSGKQKVEISYTEDGVTKKISFQIKVASSNYIGTNCTENEAADTVSVGGNGYYVQTDYTKFSEGQEATITVSADSFGDSWNTNGFALTVSPTLSATLGERAQWTTQSPNLLALCFKKTTDSTTGESKLTIGNIYWGNGTASTSYSTWLNAPIGDDNLITITVKKVNGNSTIIVNGASWSANNTLNLQDGFVGIWTTANAGVTVKESSSSGSPLAPVNGISAGILDTLVNDKQGLRFNYTLQTVAKDGTEKVTIGNKTYTVSKIGMLVSKNADTAMTIGNSGVQNGIVASARDITVSGDQITYTFSILIKNIGKANKNTDIYACPYLLCEDGTILYGKTQVTNVYEMYESLSENNDFDASVDAWMAG